MRRELPQVVPIRRMVLKSQCKVMYGLLWKSLTAVRMAGQTRIIGPHANQAPSKKQ